jgi:PTH1 family peptidyl-tRNA hydrolase
VYTLIGLGNPGSKYQETRHNIGYFVIDHIASIDKIPFMAGKGDYYYKKTVLQGNTVYLVKPTAYMNRSGLPVKHFLAYFKIPLENMLVICDDFNLPFGKLRFREKGSDGGHNGLGSIIYHLQTENFNRLRIGIGDHFNDPVAYVLENFTDREMKQLGILLPVCKEAVWHWLRHGTEKTMNQYNRQILIENGDRE